MKTHPLPETANDNYLILPASTIYNFEHDGILYALSHLPDDDFPDPLDWLDADFMRGYVAMPEWYRAQVEASVPKPKLILRDEPTIDYLECQTERSDGAGLIQVANVQPHHRMSEIIERSSILYVEASLADPDDWSIFSHTLLSTPLIMMKPGHYLEAARQAIRFALNHQNCIWINIEGADRDWANRLKQYMWITPGDLI